MTNRRYVRAVIVIVTLIATVTFAESLQPTPVLAQTAGTCVPVAERASRTLGCYITAREELGALPKDTSLYWFIDSFPSRAAAEMVRERHGGTVVESLGRVWLFTIAARHRHVSSGTHVQTVGPLPLIDADSFSAVYMEGVFEPGMRSQVHRHPGVEAWYTLEGEQCLETPRGTMVQRAGGRGVMVPGGDPMVLTGTGTGVRRSIVLILQDATKPRSTPAPDWTPKGLCGS